MAIFIKDENYKELSKIFLKDIEDYKQICKVYICTGPNQYELLFDGCADVFCDGTEDGECSDCRVRWLSIYDDLLLGTDGPTPEGISKVICPITECASNGLNTTCMDDEVCCKCGVDIFGVPFDPVVCQSLLFPSCPCLKLDSSACSSIPEYITNTCQAYAYAALTGELGSEENCKSCIDPTQTEIGKCCKFGRKYTYIKNTTWNNNPNIESNCGIRRNCETFALSSIKNPETNPIIIDYGYGPDTTKLVFAEGGIAEEEGEGEGEGGGDASGGCVDSPCMSCEQDIDGCCCARSVSCGPGTPTLPLCQCILGTWIWLQQGGLCNEICVCPPGYRRETGSCGYTCVCDLPSGCGDGPPPVFCDPDCYDSCCEDGSCPHPEFGCGERPPEGCDICRDEPCGRECVIDCVGEPIDWCSAFCIGNEINWPCLLDSLEGTLTIAEIITLLRNLNCPCAPDFDACNDICYNYFGTDQVG